MTMPSAARMIMDLLGSLRAERIRQGMSKSEMARRVGANRGQFSAMEDGAHMPSLRRVMQMAAALGVVVRIAHETPSQEPQSTERTAS